MAAVAETLYASSQALTCTLASLATAPTLLVGRNATAIDLSAITNPNGPPIDIMVGGSIMTGTTPTASKLIEVWASGSQDGTNYAGSVPATDAALTMVAETKGLLRLVASIATNATSNTAYTFSPISLTQLFGVLPLKFNLFVTHNTGVALNSTAGNQFLKYTAESYKSQ